MTTPLIGDTVRIDHDRGTGTQGAIGPVLGQFVYETRDVVIIDVLGKPIDIWADQVTVVHYDLTDQTWKDGR